MSLKKILLSGVAALAMAVSAKAATITYTLSLGDNNGVPTAGRYTLYAEVTGGSQGLASFQANIVGVTTATNQSPKATYHDTVNDPANPDKAAAFTASRAAANKGASPGGGTSFEFTATQDTIGFSQDPTAVQFISGMGQTGGSFATQIPAGYNSFDGTTPSGTVGTNAAGTWSAKLMLATGTYTVGTGTPAFSTSLPTAGNVFTDISTGGTQAATIVTQVVGVPEPTAIGLLAVAGAGLLARRRRIA